MMVAFMMGTIINTHAESMTKRGEFLWLILFVGGFMLWLIGDLIKEWNNKPVRIYDMLGISLCVAVLVTLMILL